ncbi:hypothetical protein FA13DRAFT_1455978 [Coprinellus micaceus]|uniref:Uncharacterized protein n=1 Tax=Coprinellus micaceus TaxID=71717 RepID=A0A4Y7SN52_COPMI|nr:hypothetical protein FA13DRAFT_1455978 [Coprinellus micaceus]
MSPHSKRHPPVHQACFTCTMAAISQTPLHPWPAPRSWLVLSPLAPFHHRRPQPSNPTHYWTPPSIFSTLGWHSAILPSPPLSCPRFDAALRPQTSARPATASPLGRVFAHGTQVHCAPTVLARPSSRSRNEQDLRTPNVRWETMVAATRSDVLCLTLACGALC